MGAGVIAAAICTPAKGYVAIQAVVFWPAVAALLAAALLELLYRLWGPK